jgi:hypothetical protein
MENDAHVVGPDAPIANGIGQFCLPVIQELLRIDSHEPTFRYVTGHAAAGELVMKFISTPDHCEINLAGLNATFPTQPLLSDAV